jgi:flotillin
VAVGTQPEIMQNAAIRLLGLDTPEVRKQAEHIIFGQLRQVIASMSIEEINRDREMFLHSVQNSLEPELRKIGLVLINVNIKDITDESGYIVAIGKKAAATAIQQARGDVADQEKSGEIRVAEAERDKQVKVADAAKQQTIGIRSAERDRAVRVAELEKEQTVGEQGAAFLRDAEVKDRERGMRIAVADANAKAVDGENTSKAQIAASNAGLQVKEAEAYQLGETRRRVAEAAVLEEQNRALAKAAEAEAVKIEQERRAALEAPAKAEKAQTIVDAEAEAEKRRIEAEGEAKAIFVKLEAEARGQYEILAKKGEGLAEIVKACGGSHEAFQMLMLEQLDTLAHTSAEAISNIKFDKIVVWENGGAGGTSSTANFLNNLSHTLPPMLQVLKDIGGVEIPESLIKVAEDGMQDDGHATPEAQAGASPKTPPKPEVS